MVTKNKGKSGQRQCSKKCTKKRSKQKRRNHPKFTVSKLEDDFARDFLDKLGIEYVRQFEAKDIGRFYDFFLPKHRILLEIDGGYYHSDPRVVDENNLSPMQKRNKRVDELKDKWALTHGIPIMRIWEKDIRENPQEVMKALKERLYIEGEKVVLEEKKNKRHVNKIRKKKDES